MENVNLGLTHKNSKFAARDTNYIDRFMGMKLAPDMLINKLFPDSKEITESFGMYEAMKRVCIELGIKLSDNVKCVVVGDGHRCRTGALIAFCSNFNCISIDPEMNLDPLLTTDKRRFVRVDRARCFIQDGEWDYSEYEHTFIIHPHSHAKLSQSLAHIKGKHRHLISMQCCVKDDIAGGTEYRDKYVHSPHNLIRYWTNI